MTNVPHREPTRSPADHAATVRELRDRAEHEPLHVDIADYSDEFAAGFLAGQANALAVPEVVALAERASELERERDEALRGNWKQEPNDEGGHGKEETYWLRNKLRSCVVHLRDIEDFYRLRGGTPESFNMARADRARSLYEQISEDFINGRLDTPTMRERAERAETALRQIVRQYDHDDDMQAHHAADRARDALGETAP